MSLGRHNKRTWANEKGISRKSEIPATCQAKRRKTKQLKWIHEFNQISCFFKQIAEICNFRIVICNKISEMSSLECDNSFIEPEIIVKRVLRRKKIKKRHWILQQKLIHLGMIAKRFFLVKAKCIFLNHTHIHYTPSKHKWILKV